MASGVGAKISWHAASPKVFEDMRQIFAPYQVERVQFEIGEKARQSVLAAYQKNKNADALLKTRFSNIAQMQEAATLEIKHQTRNQILYVFLQESERKGVYQTSVTAIIKRLTKLLEYDQNTVYFSNTENSWGFLVDYEADEPHTPYQLEIWGL